MVSVIVPAWQERGTLKHCLVSLRQVEYAVWEVIVVAGGPDGTYQAALAAVRGDRCFRVIEQRPRGKNAALNQGLRAAIGDVIVLLDADARVTPSWLRALVAPLSGHAAATTGNPVPLRRTSVSLAEHMERISAQEIRGLVSLQGSGSIALGREVVEVIGGFPEEVLVGVDWDLNARIASRGLRRVFCAEAVVFTERPTTLAEYWQNEMRWRRAHFASLFRHRDYFLADPRSLLTRLHIYALAWFSAGWTLLAGVLAAAGDQEVRSFVLAVWAVFAGWLLLRRVALAGEVAAYTGDLQWLKLAWVPSLLLCLTLAAILPATLTWRRQSVHFKGPRLNRAGYHAD